MNQHFIFLKWVFSYKCDANKFFYKYKTHLMIKKNLQKMNNQNVYAAILAFKMFRILITFMTAFNLEIKQLNAVKVFLNANNDEAMYFYFSNDYK